MDKQHIDLQTQLVEKEQKSHNKIDVSFKDLEYYVWIKSQKKGGCCGSGKEKKQILQKMSGVFKKGELNAIMGASGSGKTTLLNVLAQRVNNKQLSGEVLMNNTPYGISQFSAVAGYVMQSDTMFQYMTPYELIKFAADLKYQGNDKEAFINQIIDDFKINDCKDTYVGGELVKGISGGERKRTSIALELIKGPDVLLLDEPTSGLDSFTSFIITEILKKYCQEQERTVIMTIHQPNQEVFELFDRLTLMLDGHIIFQDKASSILSYLQSPLGYTLPQYSSVSDFFMQILHPEHAPLEKDNRFANFISSYKSHQLPSIENDLSLVSTIPVMIQESKQASFSVQFSTILKRTNQINSRNPVVFRGKIIGSIALGLIAGFIWFQISNDPFNVRSNTDRVAALFFLCMSQFQQSFNPVIITFPLERAIFLREHNSGLYGVHAYYFARIVPEIIQAILFPCIVTPITYFLVAFNTTHYWYFFINLLFCILNSLCGNSLGIVLGSMTSNVKVASGVSPMLFLPLILCSGFYSNVNTLPFYTRWINYVDPFGYVFNALLHNEFDDKYTLLDPLRVFSPPTQVWDSFVYLLIFTIILRFLALFILRCSITKLQS